ncbi:MAG TPA: AsnC family transcriptional regulator, partial [Jatrophihabitantaceae bacterium]|nr:AsnC family transcriptional regulator [Jatrophihabitantaceae bacterium]
MDGVDRQLLDALRANARATYAELARIVNLSAPAVHERVAKLESAGVITGYHASVSPESLGYAM